MTETSTKHEKHGTTATKKTAENRKRHTGATSSSSKKNAPAGSNKQLAKDWEDVT
jgi:hypothetical protein